MEQQDTITSNFPSHFIDPKQKGEKWISKYITAAHNEWKTKAIAVNERRRSDYITDRKYAEGNQSVEKYINQLTSKKGDKRVSYMDLNYQIESTIPKYRDVVLGYLSKFEWDITISAVDQFSTDQKKNQKYKIWAHKMLLSKTKELEKEAGQKLNSHKPPFLPQSMTELNIFMENNGIKLPDEVSIEEALKLIFHINDALETKARCIEDFFDLGIAATKTYRDKGGRVKIRYVDPVNAIVGTTRRGDYDKARYLGEVRRMTIAELRAEAGNQFTDDEYFEMANSVRGKYGNPTDEIFQGGHINTDDVYGYEWENHQIEVVDLQFKSINQKYTEKAYREGSDEYHTYDKDYGYDPKKAHPNSKKKRKVEVTDIQVIYEGKLVLDSDGKVYDARQAEDIYRDEDNLRECMYDYTFIRSHTKSIVERLMPIADASFIAWIKLQNTIAKARPRGIAINIDALESVNYGGKILTPKEVVKIYDDTGNFLYKTSGHFKYLDPSTGSPSRPVEELNNGLGQDLAEYIGLRNAYKVQMEEVSGINDIMAASTPGDRQAVGTSQLAMQASHNAIKPIFDSIERLYEKTARKATNKVMLIAKFGGIDKMKHAIGSPKVEMIKLNKGIATTQFYVRLTPKPNEQEILELRQTAMSALSARSQSGSGGIDYSDYLSIVRMSKEGNIKLAEALLEHKIQERAKQDQQAKERMIQIQKKGDAEAAQQAAQLRMQEQETKTAGAIKEQRAKTLGEIVKLNKEAELESIKDARKNGYDIEQIQVKYREELKKELEILEEQFKLQAQMPEKKEAA